MYPQDVIILSHGQASYQIAMQTTKRNSTLHSMIQTPNGRVFFENMLVQQEFFQALADVIEQQQLAPADANLNEENGEGKKYRTRAGQVTRIPN